MHMRKIIKRLSGKHKLVLEILLITGILTSCSQNTNSKIKESQEHNITPQEIAHNAKDYAVAITVMDGDHQILGYGSGFIVENGKVITNLHVIEGAKFAIVSLDKEKFNVNGYITIDQQNDLALLSCPLIPERHSILQIDTTIPKVGSRIFSIGNPHGLEGTFAEGNVSAIRDFDGRQLIQITAPISPGSSGGPIINEQGQLTGIAVGGIIEGQNLNFSIPSIFVRNLLAKGGQVCNLNIPKKESKSKKLVETDLKNAVIVRNIRWFGSSLGSFSVLNNLNYPVNKIKLLFIVYDESETPSDYKFCTIFKYNEDVILPGLAKTFDPMTDREDNEVHSLEKLSLTSTSDGNHICQKYEVRVLDYSIIKE